MGCWVLNFWKKKGIQKENGSENPIPTISSHCPPNSVLIPTSPHPAMPLPHTWNQALVRAQGACPAAGNGRVESWLQCGCQQKSCVHARALRAITVKQWLGPTILERLYFTHINYGLHSGMGTYNSICITVSMGKLIINSKHTIQGFTE